MLANITNRSENSTSPRKRNKIIGNDCTNLIKNVHQFFNSVKTCFLEFKKTHPSSDLYVPFDFEHIIETTSVATQLSVSTIKRTINCENPETSGPKRVKFRKFKYKCDSFLVSYLRRVLYGFYERKEYPNLSEILKKCLQNPSFPKISKSLLHIWLTKHCKFKYKKFNKKPVYLDRKDI